MLMAWLAPFAPFLAQGDVTDIFVNRPGEIWVERMGGGMERHDAPEVDEARLWLIARGVAGVSHQGISREHPLMAATLPDGARVQVVAPPAARAGMAIAIRKHVAADLTLGDLGAQGMFDGAQFRQGMAPPALVSGPKDGQGMGDYLAAMVRARRNILISGGTSSGKTTLLNALIGEIPRGERLVTIEDTPELSVPHANAVGLLAVRGAMGEAQVGVEDLLQASLRMRPNRIMLGELRGREAYSFLRAVNTGHPGSMTTIHADSPEGAIEQLALIVLQAGLGLGRGDIVDYARSVVDLVVQMERRDGQRRVSRIITTRAAA
ncbi:P-type DNA transfer ATPase VirB11 [Novosphingobium sp. KACC 22771]|uniref:P-type DNA transfer ATPase VirB11 n=1 Tax=Novosphingobium sp. KACC 22771 TaxID=3025670 RepID=UPI002366C939|nr:P-type DNA transfer ATPase VirB11 [Novosphingobium sp. KACC 22771]WDF71143.1 P-type DNA transfer ATPase VirB11 [Novosphingobium sp. KACC 22771]